MLHRFKLLLCLLVFSVGVLSMENLNPGASLSIASEDNQIVSKNLYKSLNDYPKLKALNLKDITPVEKIEKIGFLERASEKGWITKKEKMKAHEELVPKLKDEEIENVVYNPRSSGELKALLNQQQPEGSNKKSEIN